MRHWMEFEASHSTIMMRLEIKQLSSLGKFHEHSYIREKDKPKTRVFKLKINHVKIVS